MSITDLAELFASTGLFLLGLSAALFLIPSGLNGPVAWPIVDLLSKNKNRDWLLADLKNKKIVAGGIVGLMIYGAIIGVALLCLGGVLYLVGRL